MDTRRVVVFLDSQNVYRSAREAFFSATDFHTYGNVRPRVLAEHICSQHPFLRRETTRALEGVRIYTGAPSQAKDPKGYSAHRRRISSWKADRTDVFERLLHYRPNEQPHEKGIDVSLAIDFVVMAVQNLYDVGVIFSSDTDLRPAVEYVTTIEGKSVEIAVWKGQMPLDNPSKDLWCHRLDRAAYDRVADLVDYNIPTK